MLSLRRFEVVAALLLTVCAQAEVWLAGWWLGPEPLAALIACAPLALIAMREHPLVASVFMYAAYTAYAIAFGQGNSITEFFASFIALVVVATVKPPGAYAAPVAAVLALTVAHIQDPEPLTPGDWIFPYLFMALAWGIGRMIGRRDAATREANALAVKLSSEQQAVAKAAVVDERMRLARELHDVVAHGISVMVVQAAGGRATMAADPEKARTAFDSIETTGQQALIEMRRLLGVLKSSEDASPLLPQPGLTELNALVSGARGTGVNVSLEVSGDRPTISPGVDLSGYRIVQEALTNTIKHSNATDVMVLVRYEPEEVHLEILDDGCGINGSTSNGGHGLDGMRERVELYDGTLFAGEHENGGFVVRAKLPVRG